ncbi:MAG: AP-3 complex subunit delta [Phylliscum demangeonii]|nr:MAG: AP-3 complex subunit delta [Phylliscum demangeonii]
MRPARLHPVTERASKHDYSRFEKSLYDLIRGLRNHKGGEREYIQASLRECRKEVQSKDMDVKATALLKLIYLEMYGHDMSWAAFHVLEVMSSVKYLQKRVGYLGAVQSFRPDTEVLMLATNLLKKDLTSSVAPILTLPLITLPHVITPSLAIALAADLLPRLTHAQAAIRKKTIVTLYRFALVYPEALRPAWPKIKERLMDESEDPSVTAAIVNVVCELGWRRPQDFLPLAPRLFDLLVDGGNNWMAIKIVKLFAILTPLEPRLVRKLLPPLTTLIKTTPAMSLLYECINGIIQGGILESTENTAEGEEIASLCIGKLCGMIAIEGDPNLKYVALLAFQKIVRSHPHLVAGQQDAIVGCIDDPDVSIRLQALDLLASMVDRSSLTVIVGRLMRQLCSTPLAAQTDDLDTNQDDYDGVAPAADLDGEDPEESLRPRERRAKPLPSLSEEYRVAVIRRILEVCSKDTYANVADFSWYISILVQLIALAPVASNPLPSHVPEEESGGVDVTVEVGRELLNVAVRVKDLRTGATRAAEGLLLARSDLATAVSGAANQGYLTSIVWMIGEYASLVKDAGDVLSALIHSSIPALPPDALAICLQAIPKLFVAATAGLRQDWGPERRSMTSLLIARIVHFLDRLTAHADLEVQERAVEFAELMKLAAEAVVQVPSATDAEAPLLLTRIIPSLFTGAELNPVAATAQRKVPSPAGLSLDAPINPAFATLLHAASRAFSDDDDDNDNDRAWKESTAFYHQRPTTAAPAEPAAKRLDQAAKTEFPSYQQPAARSTDDDDDAGVAARRRAARRERHRDDPFYIPTTDDGGSESGSSTPIHAIIRNSNHNGTELDIDAIPIMHLNIDGGVPAQLPARQPPPVAPRQQIVILRDETITHNGEEEATADRSRHDGRGAGSSRTLKAKKKALLQVDSSGISALTLEDGGGDASRHGRLPPPTTTTTTEEEEEEMAQALREIERLRLEMQRAAERVQVAQGVPPEAGVLRKKVKKKEKEKGKAKKEKEREKSVVDDEGSVSKKKKPKRKKTDAPPALAVAGTESDAPLDDHDRPRDGKASPSAPPML